jgi:hypothetical protein
MAKHVDRVLEEKFACPKCEHRGGHAKRLSMAGTGLSRLFDVQPHRYIFVSCDNCGYTEVYDLDILDEKDDIGKFADILFALD